MSDITIYNSITGEIHSTVSDTGSLDQYPIDPWYGKVEGRYSGKTYYINTELAIHSPNMKSESPATSSGNTISNLHIPATIVCDELNILEEITDGTATINTDTPGTYLFTVKSVPHFDKVLEVII